MEITLDQLLASRDDRWARQQELLKDHPGLTLICLTVIMPGRVKRSLHSLIVAKSAVKALKARFERDIVQLTERDLPTGYEAYLLIRMPETEAKRATCDIEDTHPLGRLFDMDVIGQDGVPLSRSDIGQPPRRCLLCDNEARYCMRNHTHTQEELLARITEMTEAYVQRL